MVIFIRVLNLFQLFISYILANFIRKPIIFGTPAFISIEPTNRCNLRCPECPTGQSGLNRATGNLNQQDFNVFIDQLSPQLAYLTLYFQGEPYLNKDLFKFIAYARSRNVYVWTSTNGHCFSEENIRKTIDSGLNKLVISLDGTDQKTYEQYRIGGSFETVVEGIRDFVRIRKKMTARKPLLEIQFLVLKPNQHQVSEIKKFGKSLGADRTVLKTAQFNDFEHGNPLMPDEGKWSRYKRIPDAGSRMPDSGCRITNPEFILKNPLRNRCFRMWSGCVITWDGKVVPCCFDKDAEHCLGDLKTQSFKEIWKGEKYQRFRKAILKNRKTFEMCKNCSQRW